MISFIVATVGRPSLQDTLRSIETYPGDEIIVTGAMTEKPCRDVRFIPHAPGGDWGHTERNDAMPLARCRYMAHIDDDDVYVPGTRALMENTIRINPGRPAIFRMRFPNGITLWENEEIRCGNLGTPCLLIPNRPTMLGTWGSFVGGDCAFLESSKWKPEEYVWRPEVIALLGHNTP
jgi:hypothetical protein